MSEYRFAKVPDGGDPITSTPEGPQVPDRPILPFIMGDGVGPDIWKAAVQVFDAAVRSAYGTERKAIWSKNADRWGKQWIVVANPTYGSWESTPFGFNYRLSGDEKRSKKLGTLEAWTP